MGLIKAFETTYELAWRVLKAFFLYQGNPNIDGSRAAFQAAVDVGLLADEDAWMQIVEDRSRALHAYDEAIANALGQNIPQHHLVWFKHFADVMRFEMSEHAQYSS